jgi:hypothetical protein
MAATGNLSVSYGYTYSTTGGSIAALVESFLNNSYINPFGPVSGTGAGQFDVGYSDNAVLVATSRNYILSALPGLNGGTAKVMARLKGYLFINLAAAGSGFNLLVEPGTTHPFVGPWNSAGVLSIPPGGIVMGTAPDATGWPAVATTSDQLKIDAGANTITPIVMLLGASV